MWEDSWATDNAGKPCPVERTGIPHGRAPPLPPKAPARHGPSSPSGASDGPAHLPELLRMHSQHPPPPGTRRVHRLASWVATLGVMRFQAVLIGFLVHLKLPIDPDYLIIKSGIHNYISTFFLVMISEYCFWIIYSRSFSLGLAVLLFFAMSILKGVRNFWGGFPTSVVRETRPGS